MSSWMKLQPIGGGGKPLYPRCVRAHSADDEFLVFAGPASDVLLCGLDFRSRFEPMFASLF